MASLVEALDPTSEMAAVLYRGCEALQTDADPINPPFGSPFDDLTEELWCLMPASAPESPEYLTPSRTPVDTDTGSTADSDEHAAALVYELLEYQKKMMFAEEAVCESPSQLQPSEHLLYDCMWGSCENKAAAADKESAEKLPKTPSPSHVMAAHPADEPEVPLTKEECVEPAAVFPGLKTEHPCGVSGIRTLPPPIKNLNSSESEEEIDVVTVVERFEHKEETHRRTSQSAPVSRHSSPLSSRRKRHAKRMVRMSSQSSQNSNDSDDEARRASHNVLERKRRNDLKNSFDMLRQGIPELEENLRAPKVIILRKACEYIKCIQQRDQKLKEELLREQARQKRLLEKLAYLRNIQTL